MKNQKSKFISIAQEFKKLNSEEKDSNIKDKIKSFIISIKGLFTFLILFAKTKSKKRVKK